MNRCVISVAVGKEYYLNLAINLLESFLLWNNKNDLKFLLITDNSVFFTKYRNNPKVIIQEIGLSDSEKSFTSKFRMFDCAIEEENLFIDCDCLVYKDLSPVFDAFKDKNFSAIGNDITDGEFFCNVKQIISNFGVKSMPKFVGSIYYFKKNPVAKLIFEKAAELKNSYDDYGFVRLRNKENEEPLFAIAMALHGEKLLPNDGQIKADMMFYKNVQANVLKGTVKASGPKNEEADTEIIPAICNPAILHFNADFSESWIYNAEILRLNNRNAALLNLTIFFKLSLPNTLSKSVKNTLRPIYHLLFGLRKVKNNALR